MRESGKAAGAPKHRGVKVPGGGKRPATSTVRQQLHLGAETVQRLGVHCSMVGKDRSKVADEILSGWLVRFGRGRGAFDSPDPVGDDDRRSDGDGARDTGEDGPIPRGL
jgi:hypothetical protein